MAQTTLEAVSEKYQNKLQWKEVEAQLYYEKICTRDDCAFTLICFRNVCFPQHNAFESLVIFLV